MSTPITPELAAGREFLSGGDWVHGLSLLDRMAAAIPPAEALREAQRYHARSGAGLSEQMLIRRGGRRRATAVVSHQIKLGSWQVDVARMTRAHWGGDRPWRVRDCWARYLSPADVVERIDGASRGVDAVRIRYWIQHGFAPPPATSVPIRIDPEQVPIYAKLLAAWPGTGRRWSIDPTSLWRIEHGHVTCPNCHTVFQLFLRAAGSTGLEEGALEG